MSMRPLQQEVAALRRLGLCRSCGDTGRDRSSGEPCILCPSGWALRDAVWDEPCYGTCVGCGAQDAELWRVGSRWLCWRCAG